MKVGEQIHYKGYPITHPCEEDYVTEIAHDTLGDAKKFIAMLLKCALIEEVKSDKG